MHGLALPSVYENGRNDYKIALLMITSCHWDCYTVYATNCYVIKANMLTNTSKLQYLVQLGSWLSILIMLHTV